MRIFGLITALTLLLAGCATHFDERPFASDLPANNGWVAGVMVVSDQDTLWFEPLDQAIVITEQSIGGNQLTDVHNATVSWAPTVGFGGAMTNQAFRREEVMLISLPAGRYRLSSLVAGAQGAGQFTAIANFDHADIEFEIRPGAVTHLGHWTARGNSERHVTLTWRDEGEAAVRDYLATRGSSPDIDSAFSQDPFDGVQPQVRTLRNQRSQFIYVPG